MININKLLLVIGLQCSSATSTLADQILILHSPNQNQVKLVKEIFKQEQDGFYSGFNGNGDDAFTLKDVEVVQVHLNDNPIPEVVLRVNQAGYDGSAGYGFAIWEKRERHWYEIGGADFGLKHEIIITDRIVNGYKVYRLLIDSYDRIYRGTTYSCPDCPP